MENAEIIGFFKSENERKLKSYYDQIRPKFNSWLKATYSIGDDFETREIYQRSFTVLYKNAKNGKLDQIDASVETYLFGIAKFVVQEWRREKNGSLTLVSDNSQLNEEEMLHFSKVFDAVKLDDSLVRKMQRALKNLGDSCSEILRLYYWESNSMEAIALKTGYKNANVAKKKKYACLQKLKKLMEKE